MAKNKICIIHKFSVKQQVYNGKHHGLYQQRVLEQFLGCDKSSQSFPKFRNQIASPYLGGPVSYESVR